MSFFTGTVYSETLGMDTTISAILPHDSRYHRGIAEMPDGVKASAGPKTLVLLHGLTDNWVAWGHRSRILNFAEVYDVAVIMPEVQRSFYQDMKYGEAYFTYVADEIPSLMSEMFRISVDPENLMIAGLSMGGYGALKCALTYPERYRAVGAFSSVTDMEGFAKNMPQRKETRRFERVLMGIFGENIEVPDSARLKKLADAVAQDKRGTPIMMTCGTEDELYPENEDFFDYISSRGFNATFDKWPGIHEWGFWDTSVKLFLDRYAK